MPDEKRNGGAVRRFLELVRHWSSLLLIPITGYLITHEIRHARVDDFMSAGGRVYSSTMEPVSTNQLFEAMLRIADERIELKTPPPEVQAAMESWKTDVVEIKESLRDLRANINEIDKGVARLDERVRGIELIIRDQ